MENEKFGYNFDLDKVEYFKYYFPSNNIELKVYKFNSKASKIQQSY